MKPVHGITGGLGLLLCAIMSLAYGAEPSFGQREFTARCAMCHGTSGNGDGWMAEQLIKRPPPLTQLKKANGGVFPREKITQMVDGRAAIRSHGPSEMPAWGTIYKTEIGKAGGAHSGVREEDETNISYRIRALIDYLASIQQ